MSAQDRRARRVGRRGEIADDDGSAIIEFVFVAIVVMVPLVYLIASVATVQRAEIAVTQAARDAGRAFATGSTRQEGLARADVAVRLALTSQGLDMTAHPQFVFPGAECGSSTVSPTLDPGDEFKVCVSIGIRPPGIPRFLEPNPITTVGAYIVHIDDFRSAR